MSSTGNARQRCASFTGEEKVLIANVCAKYKNIIENKKTDQISNKDKNEVWEKIAAEVNAIAVNTVYRTSEVLKRFYENRKREVRKLAAKERNEIFATGGGPSKNVKKEPCHDIILSIMNHKTVYGLENEFDGDAGPTKEANNESTNENIELIEDFVYEMDNEQDEPTWTKYTPANLKQPITPNLTNSVPQSNEETNNSDNASNTTRRKLNASRRRPTMQVKSLTRSDIAEKYNQLLDKRLEIAEYQKKKLAEELLTVEKERNLKIQLLELQIEWRKRNLENCAINIKYLLTAHLAI